MTDHIETLRQYQQWRRGGNGPMLDPVAIGQAIDAVMGELTALREAGAAVVERWDTPLWKDVPATAEYIGRLRKALAQNAKVSLGAEAPEDDDHDSTSTRPLG